MKTLLHTLFLLPLAFTTVACDEARDIDELEAAEAAGEFDLADEDDSEYDEDELDLSNGEAPATHGGRGIDDLDNGPNPTHDPEVDADFTNHQGDPDTWPVDDFDSGDDSDAAQPGLDRLDNGPNPTHDDIDDITNHVNDPDVFPVDDLTYGDEDDDDDDDTVDGFKADLHPHGDPDNRSDWT